MLKWLKARKAKRASRKAASKGNGEDFRIISRAEHGISRKDIDEGALKVLYRLHKAGFKACLVGGAVRDLLLGKQPKDFDVATDATPEQVKSLFNNCRLIGRRFRLAHVHFGRHIIEVATFRGHHDESSRGQQDDSGRILRDNVYGDISDDVWRRDFTVNALYYDIANFSVIDYVGGYDDLKEARLRLIGDPDERYREDPVRMLRVIRFAAKLGFSVDESCRRFIVEGGALLDDVPAARLYEETLKIFHSGHAVESFEELQRYHLLEHLFPEAVELLEHDAVATQFLQLAMQSTDQRVQQDQPVTPAFLFAALLWAPLQQAVEIRLENGEPYSVAMHKAASALISVQVQHVSIPRRFTTVMRDIWALQSRFHYRKGRRAASVYEHPKFRAAYDFLCLRAQAGDASVKDDCQWWTEHQKKTPRPASANRDDDRAGEAGRKSRSRPRRRRRNRKPQS